MIRMDLQALQAQLKVVIQNHQIVVSKMRNDPQNPVLQKQLHELQAEIMALSEKQKQVVQQLRKELEKKKQQSVLTTSPGQPPGGTPLIPSLTSHSAAHQLQSPELRVVYSAQRPQTNHRLNTPVQALALTTKQIPFLNNLRHTGPPAVNNLVTSASTLTFKTPVATAVVLSSSPSTTSALLASKPLDHQKLQPLLVVPSPGRGAVDGSHTGVVLNLVPPIRVPQYPPPTIRTTGQVSPQKQHGIGYHSSATVCAVSTTSLPVVRTPSLIEKHLTTAAGTTTTTITTTVITATTATITPSTKVSQLPSKSQISQEKPISKVDQKKKDFMGALGLVTKDCLGELRNKKVERKRRTTANPQFSHAALEEKWRNAAAAAAAAAAANSTQSLAPPVKRPRGRPRLDSKPTSPSAPSVSTSNGSVVNGIHKQLSPPREEKKDNQETLCASCSKPGELLKCDSCAKSYHQACLHPPLVSAPERPWQCPDCQLVTAVSTEWPSPLAAVHSYVALKAAKEDERRKLLRRSLELKLERTQLEARLHQLKDVITKQVDRQSELQASHQKIHNCFEQLHNFFCHLKQLS